MSPAHRVETFDRIMLVICIVKADLASCREFLSNATHFRAIGVVCVELYKIIDILLTSRKVAI
jgi:hypothetical protein